MPLSDGPMRERSAADTRITPGTIDGSTDAPSPDAGTPSLRWIAIPGGSFEMGCSVGDVDCPSSGQEEPRHNVDVQAFEMLETEVTQAQYLAVIGVNPAYFSDVGPGDDCGRDCPVERISWDEARAFCAAIGGRLPSEAQWEYAARAGTRTPFICGTSDRCLEDITLVGVSLMLPVASRDPNAFGLYDMMGNVQEWVEDCWHPGYLGAPTTAVPWTSGCDQQVKVIRGGDLGSTTNELRASVRAAVPADLLSSGNGVRCVR